MWTRVFRYVSGILAVALLGSPAWAERKVLSKPELHLETRTPRYRVEKDPPTGNFILRYVDSDRKTWHKVVFEPATKIDVKVQAEVEPLGETSLGFLVYKYTITSLQSSRQIVREFIVEHPGFVYRPRVPDGWTMLLPVFDRLISWLPVYKPGGSGIAPGGAQGGFGFDAPGFSNAERVSIESSGDKAAVYGAGTLPGIVRCFARGKAEEPNFPTEPPEGAFDNRPRALGDSVFGRTMGAVPLPAERDFGVKTFLSKIVTYVGECLEEGWIQDSETARKHTESLQAIQRAREGGRKDLAENLLEKLLASLNADRKSGKLETEAHGILYYNANYLVGKL